jgi:hypothetical protein
MTPSASRLCWSWPSTVPIDECVEASVGAEKCAIFHSNVRLGGLCKCKFNLHLYCFVFQQRTLLVCPAVAIRLPTRTHGSRKLSNSVFNLIARHSALGWRQQNAGLDGMKREETLHGHIMDLHIKNSP